ncbi:MAG: hypothetical protein WCJ31_17445 [Planctomycetia bacterium]
MNTIVTLPGNRFIALRILCMAWNDRSGDRIADANLGIATRGVDRASHDARMEPCDREMRNGPMDKKRRGDGPLPRRLSHC